VPRKPAWYSDLDAIIGELQSLPRPFVDRATVEILFAVGPRRAQQILAPCITDHVGANGLADRDALIDHLRRLAQGEDVFYTRTRRRKVAELLAGLRKDRLERPQLLVEAPVRVMNQALDDLPAGIAIEAGRITIDFVEPRQALEKLLALAMAIGNNYSRFERRAGSAATAFCRTER
jgi:hypothetical protein